jgi:outer membrane lipoprotein-sorting protein
LCDSCRKSLLLATRSGVVAALIALVVAGWGCAVKRTIHITPPKVISPPKQASVGELVKDLDAWSQDIDTLTATVDFKPTTGSVYTGVIKEYQDVGGFILLKKPDTIRIIGQAPVVKTQIFDMVSDGREFKVFIPPKNRFIVGKNKYQGPSSKPLENLRPEHILDALLIPPVDPAKEKYFNEEAQPSTGGYYYVLNIVEPTNSGELTLKRRVWFDRTNLNITSLQLYGPGGVNLENVDYADYHDYHGIRYPSQITLNRPQEGYTLSITIRKAIFNQPIPPEKFVLNRPPGATLVEIGGGK